MQLMNEFISLEEPLERQPGSAARACETCAAQHVEESEFSLKALHSEWNIESRILIEI